MVCNLLNGLSFIEVLDQTLLDEVNHKFTVVCVFIEASVVGLRI